MNCFVFHFFFFAVIQFVLFFLPFQYHQRILKKFQYLIEGWGADLQSEHERYLVEKHFKKPVIVTGYPKEIKAFYMRQNDDGKTVAAMDILFPGIGGAPRSLPDSR